MIGFLNKFFDTNEKEINKLTPIVEKINLYTEDFKKLKLSDFSKKTEDFKNKISRGEPLETIIPQAFALVREASRRTTGLVHFDVQLMAGIALSMGKISEQKTGEGKTLSATPALYLHALTGKNVHLVTVNDYLARRDAGWMGPIFSLLGISVSSIINEESFIFDPTFEAKDVGDSRLLHLKPITRKEAYEADIVYGINSEFGFDYLRDNMSQDKSQLVQRGFYFAIVDEVDSVLIDEARTPHIISAPDEAPTQKYYEYAKLVEKLSSETDYKIDEKLRTAHLTEHGIGKIEKLYGIENIYEKDFDTVYHLEAALKARTLFHKEKDYIVKDGEVILVDEFTGRLMVGRRLSEGLHQAIEAKENVPIQRESKTLATVSLQNYFRQYDLLAGMTGTAVTEAEEFNKIYKLDVVVVPTHRQMIRKDLSDAIYKTARAKYSAVASEIEKAHKTGQPVLVGTTSIDKNEIIAELLRRRGIKHEVLNAKNHEREAEIIAKAGEKGAVTVATNMAGRGVDIILGGDTPKNTDGTENKSSKEWETWQKRHDEVVELGGLYVIGTERHESRRIDNQLRGRSGRQGDPGMSQFFVGLDDEIMRLFGGETISSLMTRFNMPEDVPLQHPLVSRAIEQAQVKVEGYNFDIRKHLVEYDDVLNKQREIIYSRRLSALGMDEKSKELKDEIKNKIHENIAQTIIMYSENFQDSKSPSLQIAEKFATVIPFDEQSIGQLAKQLEQLGSVDQKTEFLTKIADDLYENKEKELGESLMRQVEKFVVLSVIDNLWVDHLDAIDNLRQGIGLRGYGQKDPLVEYKNEAFSMFDTLINTVEDEIVHRVYKIHVHQEAPLESPLNRPGVVENAAGSNIVPEVSPQEQAKAKKRLGRNDPCWCGSGKKYKKCHWPN
ncbi:MAG: preprotein translocase subunit SecA [Candidatus Levybacteria bacterium RIFCSPHIGHO2_01_FULL_37_17]|nr:MAG: preprotein translocase subunit SecA [Candidatus Levybacteria bacterium RIFCSPHIGHO2_01_FULL_37_17]OGH37121.1 MAG: preprotein translocase subunit SecA [Candidatus Levybacteria bacterium RIFCSPLOWO2_01_FULL_38_23]